MYCPRCAVQNLDDAKFCRGCGTNLENVALVLSGQYQPARMGFDDDGDAPPKTWLDTRREGMKKLVTASGLLGSSLLIGAALGLFSNQRDWIMIWMVFTGWMACWGVFSLVSGIAALMDSKYLKGQIEQGVMARPWPTPQNEMITGELAKPMLISPESVTEHTTKSLKERRPTAKQTD